MILPDAPKGASVGTSADTVQYALSSHTSFCHVDDGLIFLDIRKDRYFRLPSHLEVALVRYLKGEPSSQADVSRLVASEILVAAPSQPAREPEVWLPPPTRSAVEQSPTDHLPAPMDALDVICIVLLTHLQMKTRSFRLVLESLVRYRDKTCGIAGSPRSEYDAKRLLDAAQLFMHARRHVPIETVCLLDSVAMVRFLAKKGMHAQIVFGVTGTPFSAHCWAQSGPLALNDTIGQIASHTPIRVV